jgi:two-component system sensor histidine kinase YesM
MKLRTPSLKYRMLLACVACTAVVLVAVTGIIMGIFGRLSLRTAVQASRWNLQLAAERMESVVGDAMDLANWTTATSRIVLFVAETDPDTIRRLRVEAWRVLNDRIASSVGGRYVDKLIIASENGSYLEQGTMPGLPSDLDVVQGLPFFARKLEQNSDVPDLLHTVTFPFADEVQTMPIIRRIDPAAPGAPQGWTYVTISARAVVDSFQRLEGLHGGRLYAAIGGEPWLLEGGRLVAAPEDASLAALVEEAANADYGTAIGESEVAVTYRSRRLGWLLVQVIPARTAYLGGADYLVLLFIVAGAILLLAAVIVAIMDRMVSTPIHRITVQLDAIAGGDFSTNREIESEDEIGRIGVTINRMTRDVQRLIDQRVTDEKQRRILELKMLQSQINPHFLHNTLNSIKWMADLQKAPGISGTVSSLASLLKEISKGTDEIISVGLELDLLRHYIDLERTIRGNLYEVEYDIPDEGVLGCRIIKFSLQPLVENAFLHGLAPKESGGTVTIAIRCTGDALSLGVHDDGVGMTDEQLREVLVSREETGRLTHIGLANVDERIKLTFGPVYGLKVSSAVGGGTTVTMVLPCMPMSEDVDDQHDHR